MKKYAMTGLVIVSLLGLLSLSGFAGCSCGTTCYGGDCYYTGHGSCWQEFDNRCWNQVCGSYDPGAKACQYQCTWNNFHCDQAWPAPDYDCEVMTSYDEFCLTH